jgi:hypothetical protein
MWLNILYSIGMTNLSDEQVAQYVNLYRAEPGPSRPRTGLLLYAMVLLTTQTVSLAVVAFISFQASKQLLPLNKTDSSLIMPREALVLTPQLNLATTPEKVLYIGNIDRNDGMLPVVLVKAVGEDERWYVQEVTQVDRNTGTFEAVVSIGDPGTASGAPFLVAVVPVSPDVYSKLRVGTLLNKLPARPMHQVTVVRR